MSAIRTLVLSGGGGRGAFHAGVYQYLSQRQKLGVDQVHQAAWDPEIIVGTSIGAVNGAAIAQGLDAERLVAIWKGLREKDIEGIPPTMSWLSRTVANSILKGLIGVKLPSPLEDNATSMPPHPAWNIIPGLGKMADRLLGRWNNLLDTGPLKRSMLDTFGLDESMIASSEKTLLINATRVDTGERKTFSNKMIQRRSLGSPRTDVSQGITIERILASCSIPIVYPWTYDQATKAYYWDGAVVANTPLGVAMDAAGDRPAEEPMEVVVVLMTPWREDPSDMASPADPQLPNDFGEAVTWALDWALLASFRERLNLIKAYNRLARIGRETNDPQMRQYREVQVVIVAPDDFFPAARILDYDERSSQLIEMGHQAAEKAFQQAFPAA